MNFKINPLAFTGIFPVPNALVDDNIRLAGLVQLKVILYMLRHAGDEELTAEKISKVLFISQEEVNDALVFWLDRGILTEDVSRARPPVHVAESGAEKDSEEVKAVTVPSVTAEPERKQKIVADIPISRPSHEQIAARCSESEDIAVLFQEAQSILGKTIGYDGQSVLIMLHDSYGLPIEVILMAIEYAATQNKASFSYISKIGKIWSEREIDSIEAAIEYIEEQGTTDEVWKKLRSMTEITNRNPTEKQRRYLNAWVKEFGYDADMIYYAYEESIDRTGKMSMPYMDKIIRTWHEKGIKTVTDIENERIRWKAEQEKNHSSLKAKQEQKQKSADASYDIDAYMKNAINLKYRKEDN